MKALSPKKVHLILLLTFVLLLNGGLFAVSAVSYNQALTREYSLLEGNAALLSRYMEMTDIGASRDMEDMLAEVFRAHGLFLAINGRYSDGGDDMGEWEPPASLLAATAEKPVTARVTLKGRPCAAYAFLLHDRVQNADFHAILLRDVSSLERAHRLLTLTVFLGALAASTAFSLLLQKMGLGAVPVPASVDPAEIVPSSDTAAAAADVPPHKTDLGLLCYRLMEELEEEAEARGIALTGSAMPHCMVVCEVEKLTALLIRLLQWGMTAAQGEVSLLVTREKETVTLRLLTGTGSGADALAEEARLTNGRLSVSEGGVSVEWEAFHE